MISIVVLAYNEAGNVKALFEEILLAMKDYPEKFEVIFVDDGSVDGTQAILKTLSPITIVRLRKNFGQTAAFDAGVKQAKGDIIVAMDGDGQNDPASIPMMLAYAKEHNLDVVSGWRKNRQDSFSKKFFSLIAAWIRKHFINDGIHDSGCTLKVYRAKCFECIDLYGEMHRFIPAVLKIKGFTIGEVVVNHRSRTSGVTKYNWTRGIRGMLDMVSVWFWQKYANRPLHLFGGGGIILVMISMIAFMIALYQKIFYGLGFTHTVWTMLAMFGFFIGIQFIVYGLMADILSKTYFGTTKDKSYDMFFPSDFPPYCRAR